MPQPAVVRRICPFCEASCGLEIEVDGGKVGRIRGDQADVFSKGFLCPKAIGLKDLHEDPDRLRTPLIKRNGVFEKASWSEAYAEIEARLPPIIAQHGPDAVASVLGNPTSHKMGLTLYYPRLAKALGTRKLFSASSIDQVPKMLSVGLMFGSWLSVPVPDIERCNYLLMLGANPMVSNGSLWTVPDFRGKAKAMRARGGKLVVIDPRRSETAEVADEHHFIRPGGDVFFLLGLVNTLFDEGLARPGRLAPHINGLEALAGAVGAYRPEQMAARCGIDAATMRRLARELAGAGAGAAYGRIGTCTQQYGTLCSWLIDVLNVLTGHLDAPGGPMFPKAAAFAANTRGQPGGGRGIVSGRHHSRVSGAPEMAGELPITCLAEEIDVPGPGQVRALIAIAANPVLSAPNGARLAAALQQLDFMVSLDIYLNETSRHADVILPGPSPLEDSHYDVTFSQFSHHNHARYSPPVLERTDGQPDEWQSLLRIAAIVGGHGAGADIEQLDDAALAPEARRSAGALRGPERLLDLALRDGPYRLSLAALQAAPSGIDLGPMTARIPEALRTPSGKIELAPAMLLADLRRVAADLATPAPPLVIIGRRQLRSNNSWMHNLPVLAKGAYRCTALVHPDDAARLQLSEGGQALIRNGAREIAVQVEISADMMPGVVSLPHGWGHDLAGTRTTLASARPGVNLNALLDENLRDPLSGNAVLSGVAVQMQRLE
ncbi:molybdopterin-dependent oxidoreductase [Janthinobacterium agaricidamnosum]|uniref:Molydopterin dinucleotide binding domain protein n=1 Tax=Janthinobacterium agaricidamnosum NBRC 102515 = DSM 9628 TaxID=1349767 RepID=W0V251_9BURK|nr:molybdopterin-dependent oxidoreductase [Janthinobacterium agaricidamnosum]CDG81705.1 molydopterin dinucleotide binding domain protein [Janthinobacterium agaricidamnosum NBRC 102515 = DSM 9628]